jgi:hypothetical protein
MRVDDAPVYDRRLAIRSGRRQTVRDTSGGRVVNESACDRQYNPRMNPNNMGTAASPRFMILRNAGTPALFRARVVQLGVGISCDAELRVTAAQEEA